MYGMVNDGIRRFIVEHHSEEVWDEIRRAAWVDEDCFDTMSTTPDSVTYDLVAAICERFDIDAATALEAFGEYWLEFAGRTALGKLMDFSGGGFLACLESLDNMHERIASTMPHLEPPSFELETVSENLFHLHYFSHRPGLAPMVMGPLYGLAKRFDVKISVNHQKTASDDGSQTFAITMLTEEVAAELAA